MLVKDVAFLFIAVLAIIPTCICLHDIPFHPTVITSSGKSGITLCSEPLSCISTFVKSFIDAVQSSKILSNVFDISHTTPSHFKRFLYNHIFAPAKKSGDAFPDFIANNAFQPLEEYFYFLAAPTMAKVFANSAAKYLHSHGHLNPTNAASLALKYAKAVEDIAKSHMMKGHDEMRLRSITDGFQKILTLLGASGADKSSGIASHLGKELKLAREALRMKFHY